MHRHIIADTGTLAETVVSIEGEKKEEFLKFVRKMLQWLPEKRLSAKQLLDEPWLHPELILKSL